MDGEELNLKKTAGGATGADGFIDRSKVRILLCDNDSKSSEEAFNLLVRCSYQVTPVRSARQVIDALNSEGPDIDIILAEVDLPMKKGMKMLKYITRDKDLRRIPVIMMSAQDEVSVVVKCLRLGAADYLVKPLRTNELLNLWTHMWRRRRMLGLAEKSMLNYDFDVVISDPSDANTNSTALFSDDTDDKSWRSTNPEVGISMYQEDESSAAIAAAASTSSAAAAAAAVSASAFVHSPFGPLEYLPNVPGISDRRTGQLSSGPKKSELKIGESSAFFTYVKSSTVKMNPQGVSNIEDNASLNTRMEERLTVCGQQETIDNQLRENGEAWESYSQGDDIQSSSRIPDFLSMDRSCTPSTREFRQGIFREENPPHVLMHKRDEPQRDASSLSMQSVYPYFMPGVMNQVVIPASSQLYQKNLQEQQNHANSGMVPQYNHHLQCPPHMAGMASFPYYPVSVCLQSGQVSATQSWPSFGGSFSPDVKQSKVDRREAALIKFRQKRKERCFDKKIRYVNRKKLAERRPRIRGQFVRKVNGMVVDLNGQPAPADSDEDEEEEDEHASRDSSPEDET